MFLELCFSQEIIKPIRLEVIYTNKSAYLSIVVCCIFLLKTDIINNDEHHPQNK